MRSFLKKIAERTLRTMAQGTLARYRPIIVGVTGSLGKSSTKEAIAAVLSQQYAVRKSEGNYNNEFGVPLTVLGAETPGKNPFAWLSLFLRSFFLDFFLDVRIQKFSSSKWGLIDRETWSIC